MTRWKPTDKAYPRGEVFLSFRRILPGFGWWRQSLPKNRLGVKICVGKSVLRFEHRWVFAWICLNCFMIFFRIRILTGWRFGWLSGFFRVLNKTVLVLTLISRFFHNILTLSDFPRLPTLFLCATDFITGCIFPRILSLKKMLAAMWVHVHRPPLCEHTFNELVHFCQYTNISVARKPDEDPGSFKWLHCINVVLCATAIHPTRRGEKWHTDTPTLVKIEGKERSDVQLEVLLVLTFIHSETKYGGGGECLEKRKMLGRLIFYVTFFIFLFLVNSWGS